MASIALKETTPFTGDTNSPVLDGGVNWITLRRSGRQPLRFKGVLLAETTGHSTEGRLWHEINIFRRQTGGFVVDLRVFKKGRGQKDIFHVHTFETLGEVISFLEDFDPAVDVPVNVETDTSALSTAQLTLKAVALRQQIEEAERDYRALIGDLLFRLDVTDATA